MKTPLLHLVTCLLGTSFLFAQEAPEPRPAPTPEPDERNSALPIIIGGGTAVAGAAYIISQEDSDDDSGNNADNNTGGGAPPPPSRDDDGDENENVESIISGKIALAAQDWKCAGNDCRYGINNGSGGNNAEFFYVLNGDDLEALVDIEQTEPREPSDGCDPISTGRYSYDPGLSSAERDQVIQALRNGDNPPSNVGDAGNVNIGGGCTLVPENI